jgi:hypothetical protein
MAWYSAWTRAQRLVITVPAGTVAPVSYFPVVLTAASLPTELTNNSYGRSDGGDLAFAADLGTGNMQASIGAQLPCEVVSAAFGVTPSAEIHVQVPSVAAAGTLTYIWVLYGNSGQTAQPAAGSTYGSQKVWKENGTQNYQGVYHLQGTGTPATWADSTSLANTGTNYGAVAATGQFGGGAVFDKSVPNYVQTDACKSIPISNLTLSCWLNFSSINNPSAIIYQRPGIGPEVALCFHGTNLAFEWAAFFDWNTSGLIPTSGVWTYIAATFSTSGSLITIYTNAGGSFTSASHSNAITTSTLAVGFVLMNDTGYGPRATSGVLDEARIALAVRSASWLAAEYSNQHAPGTFIQPPVGQGPLVMFAPWLFNSEDC